MIKKSTKQRSSSARRGPFKLLSSREIYENPWIRVREDKVLRPDGKHGIFGVVETERGVTIVPVDERGYCYLTREYHYAIGRVTTILPGGGVDAGETPLAAAQRELREEAGLESDEWKYLGMVHYFPAIFNAPERLYLALKVRKIARPHGEDTTLIKVIRLPLSKAVKMVLRGKINSAERCVAILMADNCLRSKGHVFKK